MSQRNRRVGEAVKEVLAERVPTLKDPRVGFVTITDVRVSGDLRAADVFYTVLPDDPDARSRTAEGLESARSLLRREVASALRIRYVPDLHFHEDPVPAQGRRIEELLEAPGVEEDVDGGG